MGCSRIIAGTRVKAPPGQAHEEHLNQLFSRANLFCGSQQRKGYFDDSQKASTPARVGATMEMARGGLRHAREKREREDFVSDLIREIPPNFFKRKQYFSERNENSDFQNYRPKKET
jgi:hypothetical protein